jgi:hypothetical protein
VKWRYSILFFCCLFFVKTTSYAQLNEAVVGKINLFEKDNFIILKADVENVELVFKNNLDYNFVALKKSISGNYSTNKQAGEFSLNPQERKSVAEIRLNIESDEEIKVYLFVKQEDILVSKDSLLIISSEQKQEEKSTVNEDDFVIKGIVIDDVITKIGKDFHDYFYQAYSTSGIQYPFIITIKEKPYYGTGSIINVEVEDKNLFEFMVKPDEEYLKDAVKQSLQNISLYDRQRKLLYKNTRI